MELNIYLVILTFIIVIVIIYLAENVTTAVLIVSLLANFLLLCSQLTSISKFYSIEPSEEPQKNVEVSVVEDTDETELNTGYGEDHDRWYADHATYTSAYEEPTPVVSTSCAESVQGGDAAAALMAQKRFRAKKSMDGAISKNADYYKHHFGGELEGEEAKPWWSQNEY
jgi:hypothetical protein